jgi:molybdenum-dependent DNA-binding transcriptional regulator ModE
MPGRTARFDGGSRLLHMRLEVRHLEVLLAIEEAGSISGAARRLGIDQPHVTRQLRRIEQRLGTEVFVRTTKGVKATATGLRVLGLARRALSAIDDLTSTEADHDPVRTRELLRIVYYGHPGDLRAGRAHRAVPRPADPVRHLHARRRLRPPQGGRGRRLPRRLAAARRLARPRCS